LLQHGSHIWYSSYSWNQYLIKPMAIYPLAQEPSVFCTGKKGKLNGNC
jgi:hypothetical protein